MSPCCEPVSEPWRLDYLRTLLSFDDSVGSIVSTLEAHLLFECRLLIDDEVYEATPVR